MSYVVKAHGISDDKNPPDYYAVDESEVIWRTDSNGQATLKSIIIYRL